MKQTIARQWLAGIMMALMLSAGQGAVCAAAALPDCGTVDLRAAPVGFKCSIENFWVYERVDRQGFGEAWKAPNGLIWSDRIRTASQVGGETICAQLGAALPSRDDMHSCSVNARYQILPNFNGDHYWTTFKDFFNAEAHNCKGGVIVANINNDRCCAVRCVTR